MKNEVLFTNAQLVGRSHVSRGSLLVKDGVIAEIIPDGASRAGQDLDGDYLLPGVIESHTDNLERHLEPRPGVIWPAPLASVVAHDTQMAGAGITTVYDSVRMGSAMRGKGRPELLERSVQALHEAMERGYLRCDHKLHLRCEVESEDLLPMFQTHVTDPLVQLVSIMDHTPGQRQWSDLSKWRTYHRDKHWTDEDVMRIVDRLSAQQARLSEPNSREVARVARERGIPLASHDDTTLEHVEQSKDLGVAISEFPTTVEAARHARELGLAVTMGSPNAVRGGSHSGNVSAMDLARLGLLDILSSDYVPESLLHAAFMIHEGLSVPLNESVAMVTCNVADALGLSDRGELAVGKRADLVHVTLHGGVPVVRGVWREGEKVF